MLAAQPRDKTFRREMEEKLQASDVDWGWVKPYASLGFCLAFARGVSEEGMLAAYGCEAGVARALTREEMSTDEDVDDWRILERSIVRVGRVGDWAFGFEEIGTEGSRDEVIRQFPPGTETVSYFLVGNAFSWFRHAVDGATVTQFEPLFPSRRRGGDPDRLVPLMRRVGLNPDGQIDLAQTDPTQAVLGLMTETWGLYIDADTFDGPLLTAWFHARPAMPAPGAQSTPEAHTVLLEPGQPGPAGSVVPLRPRD